MRRLLIYPLLAMLAACASTEPPVALLGAYRLDDGRVLSIRRSTDDTLRYRFFENGTSGRLHPTGEGRFVAGAGFSDRDPVAVTVAFGPAEGEQTTALRWEAAGEEPINGRRVGFAEEVWFEREGVRFFGQLQLPEGPPPHPAVVLVHGSGDAVATEWFYNADFFVANGIAALTFDKRGTGRSGGDFTFDFHELAADASAAVDHLAAMGEIDADRVGLAGYSQGAWVAPLAASKNPAIAFVLVSYGLIESPAEEATTEMLALLHDAGVTEAEITEAEALVRASVDLVASEFEAGWETFETLKETHGDAPWLEHLDGTPVGQLVSWPRFLIRWLGPGRLPQGLDWHYDSTSLLETGSTPMAWFLAEQDRAAPSERSIATLRRLIEAGRPYTLEVFDRADHGMLEFIDTPDGEVTMGYAPGYFRAEVEAAQRLSER